MLDTSLHATWGNWAVYTGASLLAASWEPKDSALIGSVADLLGNDEANKARALSKYQVIRQLLVMARPVSLTECL